MSTERWEKRACERCGYARRVKVTRMKYRVSGEQEWQEKDLWTGLCDACTALRSAEKHEQWAERLREKARIIVAKRRKQ